GFAHIMHCVHQAQLRCLWASPTLCTACIRHSFAVYGLRPHYALRAPASMPGMTDHPWSASHFFPTAERSNQ
ncbi:hypothetical protein, partial [Paraglaciecola chathamensis]|uniref:hypothetical protein n=1 Tax=Paraglaciecola chathamensis TaxID=368405 RepID=UPI002710E217